MTLLPSASSSSNSIPLVSDEIEYIEGILNNRDVLLFLDYDGTLTPIVSDPEEAYLGEDMKSLIQRLSCVYPVSIVTGRGMDCISHFLGTDIRSRVSVAASHGFDIELSNGERMQIADHKLTKVFNEFRRRLRLAFPHFPAGCAIEETDYSATLHYRHAGVREWTKVEEMFDELISEFPNLEKRRGKMVFEARLRCDWNKGKAVEWMARKISNNPEECFVVYIGDDLTDEDAFDRVNKTFPFHLSVIVSGEEELTRPTLAEFRMTDQTDVYKYLRKLLDRSVAASGISP
jgi:trehalose-phosphatase